MSGRRDKQIRREIEKRFKQNIADVWSALLTLSFRQRARLAWMLLRRKGYRAS